MNDSAKILEKGISYEEFLHYPHENHRVEWVDGEIVELTPVNSEHFRLVRLLSQALSWYADEKEMGEVFDNIFQMKTASAGRCPDIMYVSNANASRMRRSYLDGPADLVVEVISPDSVSHDSVTKYREYERDRVPEYWLIDPESKTAQFFQLDETGRFREVEPVDGVYKCRAIEGVWIEIEWLFQEPLPKPKTIVNRWLQELK